MLPFSLANTDEAYYNRRKYMERGWWMTNQSEVDGW